MKIVILFLIMIIIFILFFSCKTKKFLNINKSNNILSLPNSLLKEVVKEHMKNNNNDDNKTYSFYLYRSTYRSMVADSDKPPYYVSDIFQYYLFNNINSTDLNGQIKFLGSEAFVFQRNTSSVCKKWEGDNPSQGCNDESWCRKYCSNVIDKWLIKYKPNNILNKEKTQLGGFVSIQQGEANIPEDATQIIRNDPIIGVQKANLHYTKDVKEEIGNWVSVIGECPNKKVSEKCKDRYSKNCIETQFNDECLKNLNQLQSHHRDDFYNKELFDKISAKNFMVSGVCDDNIETPTGDIDCQIVAKYVATLRLNDLGFPDNHPKFKPENDLCTKHVHKVLRDNGVDLDDDLKHNTKDTFKLDYELNFWSGKNNYEVSRNILNKKDIWCHISSIKDGKYVYDVGEIPHEQPKYILLYNKTLRKIGEEKKTCDKILKDYPMCGKNIKDKPGEKYYCFTGKTCGSETKDECNKDILNTWCGPSDEYNFEITM